MLRLRAAREDVFTPARPRPPAPDFVLLPDSSVRICRQKLEEEKKRREEIEREKEEAEREKMALKMTLLKLEDQYKKAEQGGPVCHSDCFSI